MSTTHSDEIFSEKFRTKIDSVAPVMDIMPGVVIIHNLHTSGVVYMSISGLNRLNVILQDQ